MKLYLVFITSLLLASCQSQQARRPIETKTGSFINESVKRNKKLNKKEEKKIQNIISSDSSRDYETSSNGFWYFFEEQRDIDSLVFPKKGDLVTYQYDISTLDGEVIYSRDKIGTRQFRMDKEEVFSGLRLGIKLMNEGETATFLFPSNLAFGYYGDSEKIGRNVPIKSTVTLNDIKQQKDSTQVNTK